MADEELMPAAEVASEKAKNEAAAAEKVKAEADAEERRSFPKLGRMVSDFIDQPAPSLPVLLARKAKVTRNRREETTMEPWMPAGVLGMIASPGGVGKTNLLLSLAGHVAAGVDWCGLKVMQSGAVAIVLGEEDDGECQRRIQWSWNVLDPDARSRAAARTLVLALAGTGDNRLVEENKQTGPQKSKRAEDLVAYLKQKGAELGGWSLVVVDPFARFAGMDAEKDNASATSTITVLEELLRLPGSPTVLFSHHCRKGKKEDEGTDPVEMIRGSSAIKDGARWVAMLERRTTDADGNGQAVLRVVKTNRTSWDYALELKTLKGVVTGGEPKLVADIRAERAAENGSGRGGKTDPKPKAGGAGAEANERRQIPGAV